ncbi:MAG: phosphoribosylaminoimidazolesuccinocarboxamide synthase [Deltaproteobacteria bacterium]|nr:phosphoribosylaminoimidazolesuccinocarboxamide synthase [Deltaproteobacteria bacterium]
MTQPLYQSEISHLRLLFRGKVRDIYDCGNELLLVATDRLSAFDVVFPTPIPGKGEILTQMSLFWFEKMKGILPNHLSEKPVKSLFKDPKEVSLYEKRSMLVKKTRALTVEAVARGYLAGSGWNDYKETEKSGFPKVCGVSLPKGLKEAQKLPEPIFTPSTKAPQGTHDENITFEEAVKIIGRELLERVKEATLKIYSDAARYAEKRGILIADTKFEFGLFNNELILIDEVLTPDSSRFWPKNDYRVGLSPPSYDKQFVRDYLNATGWNKKPPAPELPGEIVKKTAEKYFEAFRQLTGKSKI